MDHWEQIFQTEINKMPLAFDPAHDSLHLKRVVAMAKRLCRLENANPYVVIPGAWLHDFVVVPKDSPLRAQASQISARRAVEFLEQIHYPKEFHAAIAHCIEAHSFSANIATKTREAEIVQDADRLDALGAIGLARCFVTAGRMQRSLYAEHDPFCQNRDADDTQSTIDHFYTKLFKIAKTLKTKSAQEEGQRRALVMEKYLTDLGQEI
ncbi:MAG: HD domain-containing protein [Bdellovibrionaceae bacterium]|nr:HD domain-containing protein [Pseudobdellovibrionaceae bacterium]